MLRIFEAHFRQKVKNTEPGKKFTILIEKKRVSVAMTKLCNSVECHLPFS